MTSRFAAAIFLILLPFFAFAEAQVAVETTEDYSQSYKNRRGTHGALFSITSESFYPADYRSLFSDQAGIADMIGDERFSLIGVELGYKHNFELGSIAILGNYAQGGIDGAVSGETRALTFVRQGLSANFAVDGFLDEPWVVPYVQAGLHQFLVSENSSLNGEQSGNTGISYNYRFGLLFQLDWIENAIDKTAKAERLRSSGLENTFLDVYIADYIASSNAIDPENPTTDGDPNISSSGEMGIGLKLEF